MKIFDHIGIPTDQPREGERFVEKTRVHVTDPKRHPYAVEWLRYAPDSPAPEALKRGTHIAFRVDSIERESAGLLECLAPFSSVAGHRVGFYQTEDGAMVELMEYQTGEEKPCTKPL